MIVVEARKVKLGRVVFLCCFAFACGALAGGWLAGAAFSVWQLGSLWYGGALR